MRTIVRLIVAGLVIFLGLQFFRPTIPAKPAAAELQAPPEIQRIFVKNCYSCHSDERRLSWFDEIVPGYWLVRHDILTARQHLDFSTLGAKPAAVQKATLYEAVAMIQLGAMPLPSFVKLHPEAKVTSAELSTLKAYLAPWADRPRGDTSAARTAGGPATAAPAEPSARVSLATVSPELDGFPFDATFEGWKPISTTDRGDNHTFRFILGNEIAVKAAQAGEISPWPKGARFAKIAWQQQPGADGLVHPGKFVQVELMLKDSQRYKNTEGWGWGRWRGMDLKPYGTDAHFVNECTSCHLPVRGNDYVYTLPISAAKVRGDEVLNTAAAGLPASLPFQPLGWNAITMYVDPESHTTATLYGNEAAMQAVEALRQASGRAETAAEYPAGAVLALVTWAQREDPHWFGARIPDRPASVEFVEVAAPTERTYRRFAGDGLGEDHTAADATAERIKFVLGLRPAPLP